MTDPASPLDAPFRSRRGRAMALTMAGVSLSLFAALAILIRGWGPADRLLMFGLGLAMAYGFARQSGGGISIQSQPGQGTTVHLHFPTRT